MMQRELSGRFHGGRGRHDGRGERGGRTRDHRRGSGRPPLQGAAARRRRADRRRPGRRAPEPLHRRVHHPRARALGRVGRAQPRPHGDVLHTARPRLRPARQDLDGPAALRPAGRARRLGHHPRRTAPGAGRPCLRGAADLRGQRDRGRARAAVDRRRAGRRPRLPLPLLRRLRARCGADGRGAARLRPPGRRGGRAGCGRRRADRRADPRRVRGRGGRGGRDGHAAAGGRHAATRAKCPTPTPRG